MSVEWSLIRRPFTCWCCGLGCTIGWKSAHRKICNDCGQDCQSGKQCRWAKASSDLKARKAENEAALHEQADFMGDDSP